MWITWIILKENKRFENLAKPTFYYNNKNYLIRIQIWSLSISYIHVKQKILLINETKRDEILLKPKVLDWEKLHPTPLTFVKFCDIVWPTFVYFQWPEKSYRISANIRSFFQVILTIFTLKYFGLLQNLMRNYEILWKSMKVMIFHRIFLVKSFTFVPFCSFAMYFLFISDFKIWLQNFSFTWTILKFWAFVLAYCEDLKNQYHRYLWNLSFLDFVYLKSYW